ncbi:amine oxidase catalytic domain-containing protein [Irpex rosettiformis]|uniref:Amine oxidase catalytic domain-containing protein n=1 Tax=Irpex rosettiformis TaxID=378272 RepID=A0ACB8UAR2_9APHY|nr:amine oxidase catalytic domain-containing protein [Irpex rosettiformis]
MQGGYELLKDPDAFSLESARRTTHRRLLYSVLLIVGLVACSSVYVFSSRVHIVLGDESYQTETLPVPNSSVPRPLDQCAASVPLPAKPPAPVNLWASLTLDETVSIHKWLTDPARGLDLVSADKANLSDNSIFHIEVYRPVKADALAYLESPSQETLPARYGRVSIHLGARPEAEGGPVIKDYVVGPLPVSDETTLKELTEIYHRDDIPYNARGFGANPFSELPYLLSSYMPRLAHVTQDLFGGVALGLENDTLIAGASGPFSFDGSFRRTWVSWRKNVAGPWLHPVNFFQYIDISGADPKQWKLLKLVYNHQIFENVDDFLEAYNNGTLRRLPERPDQRDDVEWSSRIRPSAPQRDLDHLPGPRQVSFAGLRFRVDRKLQYVSWMGWGMYLGFDRDMGMSLWDIRFLGDRLIYELSPQEAMAQYAGNDPMQTTTAWLDRFFGMGSAVRDMLPGYDCPYEAVYLPATTYTSLGMITRERAICVFEHDTARPITRHTGYHEGEFGAVRGYVLTVRSVSTVGNYDYIFDYMFMTDGTIEVRVSASGYLQGGFWEPKQTGYGTAIRDTTMGSLHDHVINFKVDLDVGGLENSLLFTHTEQEEVEQPWFDDDWGKTVIQQKITRDIIENENDAKVNYPVNFQGGYALINQDKKNKWDIARGYAVHPGYSPVHNTVVGSKRLLDNANWARYNLAVSRRKETEPTSSSMWNMNLPGKPMVDFHKFFDGENITQQDLVLWINVGTHHLPQAEDSPNTRTNTASSSFFLTPLNYFDSDVSMDSTNAILLSNPVKPGDPYTYNDYGVKPVNCVPTAVPPFEYRGLTAFGLDGKMAPPASAEEMRKGAEMYHRIKLEL